jgi:hypothetical protein
MRWSSIVIRGLGQLIVIKRDRRGGHLSTFADERVVINPQHRHVLGHAQPRFDGPLTVDRCRRVAEREQTQRLGLIDQPRGERFLTQFKQLAWGPGIPAERFDVLLKQMNRTAQRLHSRCECFVHGLIVGPWPTTDESDMFESTLGEVFSRHSPARRPIGHHRRHIRIIGVGPLADAYRRHALRP